MVLLGAILCLVLPARPAAAHAVLVDSEPANGATLATAPHTVVLRYSEDISPRFSSARLVDGGGRPVAGTRLAGPQQPRRLTLELPRLTAGTYGVVWQVLAEDDGHATSGVVVFSVGRADQASALLAGPATVAGSATAAGPLDVARRWLGLCALAGLIGGLAVAALVLGRVPPSDPARAPAEAARRRVLAFAAGSAAAGVVVAIVDLVAEARRVAATGPGGAADLLTGTRWGHLWLAREAVLVCLAAVVIGLRSQARPRSPDVLRSQSPEGGRRGLLLWSAAGLLVLTAASVEALGSHAAALGSARAAAIVADALHILTACLWLGSVAALALMLWPRRETTQARTALLRACRGRFTGLAFLSVGLVAATGLYNAGREVDFVDGLFTTAYGRTLLVKSTLLLAIGGLALANATRLRRSPSHRLVALETGVGVVLLLVVGVLAETTPAHGPARQAAAPTQTASGSVADLVVSVSATPNQPGVNGFMVLAASTRRPPPTPIDSVGIELATSGAPTTVDLRQIEPGRYFGTATLEGAGPVRLTVVIHRSGTRTSVPIDWLVAAPAASQDEPDRGGRLAPIVNGLALLLIEGVLAIGVWWLVRARRRRAAGPPSAPDDTGGEQDGDQVGKTVLEGIR